VFAGRFADKIPEVVHRRWLCEVDKEFAKAMTMAEGLLRGK
jgi:hypothetical protein